ncbi:MAG: hypothetical protein JST85_21025 [Acidobacteria bacterium]|nr:hypothetical protein [Acidobacteriota bacterium]
MPYRLVKGEFHLFYKKQKLVGSQPDGDSIWFKPDNRALLSKLGSNRRNAAFNAGGLVQLRLEAIDALELYFRGSHQFLEGATKARNFLLNTIGFRNVEFSGGEGLSVKDADPHPIAGYILTKAIDPDGKPVSFVYAEKTKKEDGSEPFLDIARMSRSANAKLAEAGWAYPAFYEGLPADLRNQFAALAHAAWGNKRGLWAKDKSLTGVNAPNLVSLETIAIWPKLFRRLLAYFKQGNAGLAEFDGWLRAAASRDDKLWIISEASAAYLHNIVKISRNKISLIYSPEDLVIVPR